MPGIKTKKTQTTRNSEVKPHLGPEEAIATSGHRLYELDVVLVRDVGADVDRQTVRYVRVKKFDDKMTRTKK